MTRLPIVEHYRPQVSAHQSRSAERLAQDLLRERPGLADHEHFRRLMPRSLQDAPTLHLDDLSAISTLSRDYDESFLEERARLRAGEGDFVASCTPPVPGFEAYCRDRLGLGTATWFYPQPRIGRFRVAQACWQDRKVRRHLIHAMRVGELAYVHPHMGNFAVWELAALLRQASRRPIQVIAPPPGLAQWVNDKVAFADTVCRLFGPEFIPRTEKAANFVILSQRVRELADRSRFLGLKLTDAAGGGGNLVVGTARFRGRSLKQIRAMLKVILREIQWEGDRPLLVNSWETEVLAAPSAQLWIPPEPEGQPIVEALFEQTIEGAAGYFVGSRRAELPSTIEQEIVNRCWLLARLFQLLRYVGRCSFDLLVVGESFPRCRLEFIECNGRWGGASLPMTLVNRLFGDWQAQPYAARELYADGLQQLDFSDLLERLGDDMFDARTGRGNLIFYNPGRMSSRGGIDVIALAESWEAAGRTLDSQLPQRLQALAPG